MATRLQKIIWSFLCGAALGSCATGCYDSEEPTLYGPPPDVSTDDGTDADADADVDSVDAADTSEAVVAYGPAPEYGPPSP